MNIEYVETRVKICPRYTLIQLNVVLTWAEIIKYRFLINRVQVYSCILFIPFLTCSIVIILVHSGAG